MLRSAGGMMGFESSDVIETINEIFVFLVYLCDLSFLFLTDCVYSVFIYFLLYFISLRFIVRILLLFCRFLILFVIS